MIFGISGPFWALKWSFKNVVAVIMPMNLQIIVLTSRILLMLLWGCSAMQRYALWVKMIIYSILEKDPLFGIFRNMVKSHFSLNMHTKLINSWHIWSRNYHGTSPKISQYLADFLGSVTPLLCFSITVHWVFEDSVKSDILTFLSKGAILDFHLLSTARIIDLFEYKRHQTKRN